MTGHGARTLAVPSTMPHDGARVRDARPRTGPRRDTRFRAGNRAWAARRSPGRRRRFADAAVLWTRCADYFDWCEGHPLIHLEPVVYRGELTMLLEVPRLRAFTLAGLCAHLSIGCQTWRDYRRRPAFSEVIERVESIVWVQQFEGAAAGLLDPRIVARGLSRRDRGA